MEIVTLPEQVVIGIACEGTWSELPTVVPEAWRRLFEQVGSNETFLEVSTSFKEGRYAEIVGYLASFDANVPAGMTRLVIPVRSYLHAVHEGPVGQISDTFLALENEARHLTRHTDLKLDFGYRPGLPDGPHELYVGLESEPANAG